MSLLPGLAAALPDPVPKRWVVAASGGADSQYLAFSLSRLAAQYQASLCLVHLNHGLRGADSDLDEALVSDFTQSLGLELVQRQAPLAPGENLQAEARRLRREVLLEVAGEEGQIFLGHHAADQRENLLAGLLKGKPPWAISLMRPLKGQWSRPMLKLEPQLIRARLKAEEIPFRDDQSNLDPMRYERNWLRHRVLPGIMQHPEGQALLDRLLAGCLNLQDSLHQQVMELIEQLDLQQSAGVASLERKAALHYHILIHELALRRVAGKLALWGRDPSRKHLERMVELWRKGQTGSRVPTGSRSEMSLGRERVWFHSSRPVPLVRLIWPTAGGPLVERSLRPADRLKGKLLADLLGEKGASPWEKHCQRVIQSLDGQILAARGLIDQDETEPSIIENGKTMSLRIENMTFDVLIDRQRIAERTRELAAQINRDYEGKNPILIIVLNGGFIFGADLMKELNIPCEVDFIKLSSYGDEMTTSGEVKMKKDYDSLVSGRHIIVVEDIVDSGLSLSFLKKKFSMQEPAGVRFATLLHKPENSRLDFELDYVGFEIGPEFVIGYGLDYKQNYRNLPEIYVRVDGRDE